RRGHLQNLQNIRLINSRHACYPTEQYPSAGLDSASPSQLARDGGRTQACKAASLMAEKRKAGIMRSKIFEQNPTSFQLDCFTVLNEGFRRWEPLPRAALAKAFLVITAEDVSDGQFATRIIGISLNALRDMAKNGIRHAERPSEREREIVNACLENASRGM